MKLLFKLLFSLYKKQHKNPLKNLHIRNWVIDQLKQKNLYTGWAVYFNEYNKNVCVMYMIRSDMHHTSKI